MKRKIVLSSYFVALIFAAILISPIDSKAENIVPEEINLFVPCDKEDYKNKWFSINCKPKTGHICETECDPQIQ